MATTPDEITINKILVPTDFSDISLQAIDYAARIARSSKAEIILLHVFESYTQNTMLDMRVDFTEIIERGIEEKFKEIKLQHLNLSGVTVHSRVRVGKIHTEIDAVADAENVKLIVMGTHGVSGTTNIGKYIMGSNAYRTIQNAPCPIITMHEEPHRQEIKHIVVPLDSTRESTQKMDIVIRWAKFFNAKIHLLAVTAFFEELLVDVKKIADKVHEVEAKLAKENIEYEAHIVRNQAPSESVIEYSRKINADLIFIVTGQESQLNEMLFGSSARNIISESQVPVLSVNIRKQKPASQYRRHADKKMFAYLKCFSNA